MEYFFLLVVLILLTVILFSQKTEKKSRYDERGFDHNRIHKNGTKFDDDGYDYNGYDINGYNEQGYNKFGKNKKGQYDRFFDTTSCDEEGFLNPNWHSVAITDHARERFYERLGINDAVKMQKIAVEAYRFGKSKRQLKKSSAWQLEEIEQRQDEESVALIYRNFIYIYSKENVLKTLYKNDKISL